MENEKWKMENGTTDPKGQILKQVQDDNFVFNDDYFILNAETLRSREEIFCLDSCLRGNDKEGAGMKRREIRN